MYIISNLEKLLLEAHNFIRKSVNFLVCFLFEWQVKSFTIYCNDELVLLLIYQ